MRNIDIDVGINHGGGQLIQFVQNAETTHFLLSVLAFQAYSHIPLFLCWQDNCQLGLTVQ